MEELQRENEQLRRLVGELLSGKKTAWPGEEACPVLDLPSPCECGNVIIQRFLFSATTFTLTYPLMTGNRTMKLEGTPEKISIHGIVHRDGKLVCSQCGRNVVLKEPGQ